MRFNRKNGGNIYATEHSRRGRNAPEHGQFGEADAPIGETQQPKKMDTVLIVLTSLLVAVGILMVYSSGHLLSSREYNGDSYQYLRIHMIACTIGFLGMFLTAYIPYQFYARYSTTILIVAFVGLLLVFVPFFSVSVQGAGGGRFNRWIRLPGFPFNFQPVEFAKIALIIHVATFISRNPQKAKSFFNGILPNVLILGAAFGLVAQQPDFGSALLLAASVCLVLFVGGIRIWQGLLLGGAGVGVLSFLILRNPYRLKRFLDYIALWKSPEGANYQLEHSLKALGWGGFFGAGIDNSVAKVGHLPYPHTDFIFAILGEEFGFFGTACVTLLFMLFVWRGLHIARDVEDLFGALFSVGLTTLIGLQAFINIGVVTGVLPTKGITLPFISYGGSSIVLSLLSVGILLNISRFRLQKNKSGRG